MQNRDLGQSECSCPYPEAQPSDVHRGCPLHGEQAQLAAVERAAREVVSLLRGDLDPQRRWTFAGKKFEQFSDAGVALISLHAYLNDLDYIREHGGES